MLLKQQARYPFNKFNWSAKNSADFTAKNKKQSRKHESGKVRNKNKEPSVYAIRPEKPLILTVIGFSRI